MEDHRNPEPAGTPGDGQSELKARRAAFGERLRGLREDHGASLDALAETTRISSTFIKALEAGDLERLPGRVFGRGFVQNIAKNFGVDAGPWLIAYNDLWTDPPARSVLKVEIKSRPMRQRGETWLPMLATASSLVRRGVLVKILMPICAVVFGLYMIVTRPFWRQGGHHGVHSSLTDTSVGSSKAPKQLDLGVPAPVDPSPASDLTAAAPAPAATKPATGDAAVSPSPALIEGARWSTAGGTLEAAGSATPEPANPDREIPERATHVSLPAGAEQTLVLQVLEPVRIRLDVDRGQAVTKELKPDTYKFTFVEKADMMIYDAAAVRISFNGRPLGSLGSKGRVRRLSFQNTNSSAKPL